MTVIINGTTGITNVNGSAAAPAETGTDTDSGIVYGTNTVSLATNGTAALTVDSSQNVGIGTSSPLSTAMLEVSRSTTVIPTSTVTADAQVVGWRVRRTGGSYPREYYMGIRENSTALDFYDNTADALRMRINSSGNVGIGTDTANATGTVRQLTVSNAGTPEFVLRDTSQAVDSRNWRIFNASNTLYIGTLNDAGNAGTDVAKLTSAGLFQFNSGYGSVATAYGCRAWVNFNGTGTVAIRASGNVSSITDNGVGDYTVNFTTAMPDANYSCVTSAARTVNNAFMSSIYFSGGLVAGSARVRCWEDAGAAQDPNVFCVSIDR